MFYISNHLSAPFLFRLEIFKAEHDLDLSTLVGKSYDFEITQPGGKTKTFNGLVARAVMGQASVQATAYYLDLRPWFYFLNQGQNCRLFQNKTVVEIFKEVAKEYGHTAIKESLNATYPKLEYAAQYNESDFDFLSRLLEEAGIFYYFTHAKGKHTLVLADSPQGYEAGPELKWLGANFPQTPDAQIWALELGLESRAKSAQVDDYNYLTPTAKLLAKSGQTSPVQLEYGTGHLTQSAGEPVAARRLDEFENSALTLTARTSHSGLMPGTTFKVKNAPRKDLNKKWLALAVEMEHSPEGPTLATITAIPADKTFRPPRRHPRPRILGPLTGVVCGKQGEEIYTDEHGRLKVRPHWDHKTKNDENASVWLRASQGWGGAGHGAMFLPRVGDEVLISFLGGDPDRPVVTGAVYNAANKPPWALPANKTVSGFKGLSSPKGQAGNELSFDDKKDEERLYFHAQKLLEILVEEERRVTVTGETGDSLTLEKGPRTVLIKKGALSVTLEEGSRAVAIKKGGDALTLDEGDRSVDLKKGGDTLTLDEGDRSVDLKKGGDTLKVKGDRAVTVEGGETRKIKKDHDLKVDGNCTITIKGDLTIKAKNIKLEADQALNGKSGQALEIKAGTSLKVNGGTSLDLKAGTTFSLKGSAKGDIDGGGMLNVKGGLVKLN